MVSAYKDLVSNAHHNRFFFSYCLVRVNICTVTSRTVAPSAFFPSQCRIVNMFVSVFCYKLCTQTFILCFSKIFIIRTTILASVEVAQFFFLRQ